MTILCAGLEIAFIYIACASVATSRVETRDDRSCSLTQIEAETRAVSWLFENDPLFVTNHRNSHFELLRESAPYYHMGAAIVACELVGHISYMIDEHNTRTYSFVFSRGELVAVHDITPPPPKPELKRHKQRNN